jgi:hypothetical protein
MYINPFNTIYYNTNQATSPPFYAMWRRESPNFAAVSGIVTNIEEFNPSPSYSATGCFKLMSIESKEKGPVNFVISPGTYFVDHNIISVNDEITGFYDANAPSILIYPPQLPAIAIAKNLNGQSVTLDYFNSQLINSTGTLMLNISSSTIVILNNDQPFNIYPGDRNLIVVYGPTTKSIPAQTNPYKIIVLC